MSSVNDLSGAYKTLCHLADGQSVHAPGSIVHLGHEDAARMLAAGCVKPACAECTHLAAPVGGIAPALRADVETPAAQAQVESPKADALPPAPPSEPKASRRSRRSAQRAPQDAVPPPDTNDALVEHQPTQGDNEP